jgi:hypothetical protein
MKMKIRLLDALPAVPVQEGAEEEVTATVVAHSVQHKHYT